MSKKTHLLAPPWRKRKNEVSYAEIATLPLAFLYTKFKLNEFCKQTNSENDSPWGHPGQYVLVFLPIRPHYTYINRVGHYTYIAYLFSVFIPCDHPKETVGKTIYLLIGVEVNKAVVLVIFTCPSELSNI